MYPHSSNFDIPSGLIIYANYDGIDISKFEYRKSESSNAEWHKNTMKIMLQKTRTLVDGNLWFEYQVQVQCELASYVLFI